MAAAMTEWTNVRWTQARQIVELIDPIAARGFDPAVKPATHFTALRTAGDPDGAATFLGIALPRLEGIAWAETVLRSTARSIDEPEAAVLAAIGDWLREPTDDRRRLVWNLGNTAHPKSPERLLAYAVFLSGGSIAPVDLPAVQPAPELSGKLAAAAVISAAHATADAVSVLTAALDSGDALARARRA